MANENKPSSWGEAMRLATKPQAPARESERFSVRLQGADGLHHLTQNSQSHLEGRIQDFTVQVIAEARAIEQREHAGKGPPEVTAAHIDEAWWVVRRRIRRARYPGWAIAARAFETFGAAGIGVGATIFLGVGTPGFQTKWGPLTFIASVLVTMGGFLLEAGTARRE